MVRQPHRRAGVAVSGRRRRPDDRPGRSSAACAAPADGAGGTDPSETGVQPSRALPGRRVASRAGGRSDGPHRSGKVELLADLATTAVDEGDRMLVFTQFAEFAHLLAPWLSERLGAPIPGVARRLRARSATASSRRSRPMTDRRCCWRPSGRRHGTEPDRRRPGRAWTGGGIRPWKTRRPTGPTASGRSGPYRSASSCAPGRSRADRRDDRRQARRRLSPSAQVSWLSDLGDDEVFDLLALRDEAVSE